ncbi:LAME_0H19460g1_1 [Lachancea meyersii CBS 8951]|uniref:Carboxypeptidase n=1 Tax=Lachancea meyersii CBS 8951 TaxID=1266667 RepID=A0A1G4KJG7_9SACH|nr:LAME_0H19460g1_1 [Lachancea meyersii CBS 8951]
MLLLSQMHWVALAMLARFSEALYTAQDYAVSPDLLPGLSSVQDPNLIPQMYAGHIPLGPEDDENVGNYFFWKFHDNSGRASEKANNTLIFWLNGGPGCSSMDGALMESGALRIDSDGKAYLNEGGWHTRGDVVFVDQPAGTGFSTVGANKKYDSDLLDVSQHFLNFLHNYFHVFPDDLAKNVILAGESYAGQYIPYFAQAILNNNSEEESTKINLKALLIGNGWMDPNRQSLSYIPFAFQKGLIQKGDSRLSKLLNQQELCQNKLNSDHDDRFSFSECDDILGVLLDVTRVMKDSEGKNVDTNQQCTNMYDLRLKDSYPSCGMNWPADLPNVAKFFGTTGVIEALHLDSEKVPNWHECDDKVSGHLTNPTSRASAHILPSILESGLEVVLFNGDQDIICNNLGVETLISELSWNGEKGFTVNMQYYDWMYKEEQSDNITSAGFVKYERNLTFISVYNASHMVPFDNSLVSRGIVDIYLNDVELVQEDGGDTLISESFSADDSTPQLDCEGVDKDSEECRALATEASNTDVDEGEGDENQGNKETDTEDEDDEDDEDDDDDDDDKEDDEGDEENDSEDEVNSEPSKDSHRIKVAIVSMSISAAIIAGLYFMFRDRFRPKLRAILVDSKTKSTQRKKNVSWASDLEQDAGDLKDPPLASKQKDGYSNVPTEEPRGSFELDDL